MANGQKLTINCSERYLGSYSYDCIHETVNEAEDLREDDVWSVVEDVVNGSEHYSIGGSQGTWHPRAAVESNESTTRVGATFAGCPWHLKILAKPPRPRWCTNYVARVVYRVHVGTTWPHQHLLMCHIGQKFTESTRLSRCTTLTMVQTIKTLR
ncbi:Double-stranded RNA-specific editase [Actinidia chinensis var. chinensis]|uniref:Double-stranded RNA-specific editase n=1 Tax=Actinidia chinensis var. chinensis TaxID=1590841 RepID=A0A2R6PY05_ACTCC|nr:Double-stranded RNA-specific editase [Actinidia chinensis var. chinensis]